MMSLPTKTDTKQKPVDVTPEELKRWLDADQCVLIDVREDAEHREERIAGAQPMPLSRFDPQKLRAAHAGKRIVFHCKGGKRSTSACQRFSDGEEQTQQLAGGIDAWKAAGLPTVKPDNPPRIPIMRQVLLSAGTLVTLGLALGWFVHPGFLLLSAFVGCGLMFSGLTAWCGMAMLLGKMPWNR